MSTNSKPNPLSEKASQAMLDKIIRQIFGRKNPFSLDDFQRKYAFDVQLPVQVNDATTGEITWAQSASPARFMKLDNVRDRGGADDWMLPKQEIKTMQDIFTQWGKINYMATERYIDADNLYGCDNIYSSDSVYRSQDVIGSRNLLFCDGMMDCEYVAASQRTRSSTYLVRGEDSKDCSESFAVAWSADVVKSLFIQDCVDLYECMFCSHLRDKKFCIANMQFEEAEYFKIKQQVVDWVLSQ